MPGKEGLLHVSEIAWEKTENVADVLKVGDEVDVKLLEIDEKTGKMRLSMRALTEKPEGYVEPERRPRNDRNNERRGNDRRGGFSDRRGDRKGFDNRDRHNGERRNEHRRPFETKEENNENIFNPEGQDQNDAPEIF